MRLAQQAGILTIMTMIDDPIAPAGQLSEAQIVALTIRRVGSGTLPELLADIKRRSGASTTMGALYATLRALRTGR